MSWSAFTVSVSVSAVDVDVQDLKLFGSVKMHFPFSSSTLALLTFTSSSWAVSLARGSDELVDCLKYSLSPQGSVLVPGNPIFMNDTTRVSTLDAPTFRVVSQVSNEDDVRASVGVAYSSMAKCSRVLKVARSIARRKPKPPFCSPAHAMASIRALPSYKTHWKYLLPRSIR